MPRVRAGSAQALAFQSRRVLLCRVGVQLFQSAHCSFPERRRSGRLAARVEQAGLYSQISAAGYRSMATRCSAKYRAAETEDVREKRHLHFLLGGVK